MNRSTTWPAWAILGLIVAEIGGSILLTASRGDAPGSTATATATILFVVTTAIVGTLIALRRPGN